MNTQEARGYDAVTGFLSMLRRDSAEVRRVVEGIRPGEFSYESLFEAARDRGFSGPGAQSLARQITGEGDTALSHLERAMAALERQKAVLTVIQRGRQDTGS